MEAFLDAVRGDTPAYLLVREWANGLWFALSFAMCFEICVQLIRRVRRAGWSWRHDPGARAMVALAAYFFGESLMRGWVWILLSLQRIGSERAYSVQDDYAVAMVAATISVWAAGCCLYVFARDHRSWIRAGIILVTFILAEWLVLHR